MYRGNRNGVSFHHLRASRYFAQVVQEALKQQNEAIEHEDRQLGQLLLEIYAYCDLSSGIRLLPDFEDMKAVYQSQVLQLETLKEFETAGANFGCTWELYKLVPRICWLVRQRKEELAQGEDLGCSATHSNLKCTIDLWRSTIKAPTIAINHYQDGCLAAGLLSCSAITLFLHTAYYCDDQSYLRAVAQPLVDEAIELVSICSSTPWSPFAYWPTVVIASFATTAAQQISLQNMLSYDMHIVRRAKELLSWVWDVSDEVYGLNGLAQVIKERNTSWCC